MTIDSSKGITGLKGALRYVRAYRDQVFVVKLGGEVLADRHVLDQVAGQLALLSSLSIRLVVVHGGGPQATRAVPPPRPRAGDGRRAAGHRRRGARRGQDGLSRPAQHRPGRGAPSARGPGGRADRRGCRPDHRPSPAAGAGGRRCRRRTDGGLRPRRRHRPGRSPGAHYPARCPVRAGGLVAGRRCRRRRSSTSTPTPWPRSLAIGAPGAEADLPHRGARRAARPRAIPARW